MYNFVDSELTDEDGGSVVVSYWLGFWELNELVHHEFESCVCIMVTSSN